MCHVNLRNLLCCLFVREETDSFRDEIPEDTILEILARLPIKTLLQFKRVSKTWLSIINNPSFTKLHLTCSVASRRSTTLLFSAYNKDTCQRHFLSTTGDGGRLTHLLTLDAPTITSKETTQVEHVEFTVGHQYQQFNVRFDHVRSYVESILPVPSITEE